MPLSVKGNETRFHHMNESITFLSLCHRRIEPNRTSLLGIIQKYVMQDIVDKEKLLISRLLTYQGIVDLVDEVTLINLADLKCKLQIIKVAAKDKDP